MHSYNREWDRGKEWEEYSHKNRARSRGDDETHYDDKRRKYHNAMHDDRRWTQEGEQDARAYNYDYDDYTQGQGSEERHDRGQHRKRHVASEPSSHVIFLGLDTDFTEADLFKFLKEQNCVLETVTIIRDRNTGQSKGFGFAQFKSTEHARSFVDPNFPFVSIPPPESHGASAAAAFRQAITTGAQHNGRRVKIDYSQSANPPEKGRSRGNKASNDGTRDIGNAQSAVLLVRGLDPLSGTGAISQAMKTSSGTGKEGGQGMKRILLVKDKLTMASWGFAFVEFVDVQSASAVLAVSMSAQLHPNGFRISDRPVAVSFAHPYSFQPLEPHALQDESCVPASTALGGVEDGWVKYWDEASTLAVMEFEVQNTTVSQHTPQTSAGKEKKKRSDGPVQKQTTQRKEASALPVSSKPVTLSFSKNATNPIKPNTIASVQKEALGFAEIGDPDAPNQEDESGNIVNAESTEVKGSKLVTIISKKVASNISKWNQMHETLNQELGVSNPTSSSVQVSSNKRSPSPAEDAEFDFTDKLALTCVLCSRQFKSMEQIQRHNTQSDLHKKNLLDASLREVAREKMAAPKAKGSSTSGDATPRYRDRAQERRLLHNQPDAPTPEESGKVQEKRYAVGPPPPPPPPPPPVAPAQDENNVGNKLLKMMGWTEGQGLGTEGEGRVEPVQAAIYASGVGLGASKGQEVGKYADKYSGYVDKVRDAARERYVS